MLPSLLILGYLVVFALAQLVNIKNGIKGLPVVTCGDGNIEVDIETESPFLGNVYAKGFFDKSACRVKGWLKKKSAVSISIPVGAECGTRRKRMSYHIECFYLQHDREVSQSFDVSVPPDIDLPSGQLLSNMDNPVTLEKPTCKYEVLLGGPEGSPMKYAKLGDVVYHKWTCASEGNTDMCMTVHSCVVDDGHGQGQQLVDERGCTRDPLLIANLNYSSTLEAGQTATVFRFADRPTVFFSCQIRLEKIAESDDNCTHSTAKCEPPTESDNGTDVTVPVRFLGDIEKDFPRPPPLQVPPGALTGEGMNMDYVDYEDTAVEIGHTEVPPKKKIPPKMITAEEVESTTDEPFSIDEEPEMITKSIEIKKKLPVKEPLVEEPLEEEPDSYKLPPQPFGGRQGSKGTKIDDYYNSEESKAAIRKVRVGARSVEIITGGGMRPEEMSRTQSTVRHTATTSQPEVMSGHAMSGVMGEETLIMMRNERLSMVDLMEHGTINTFRRARSTTGEAEEPAKARLSPSLLDIDVSAPSIEVSDAPLYEELTDYRTPETIRVETHTGEVCISVMGFVAVLLVIVILLIFSVSVYWLHAFHRTGKFDEFYESDSYWVDLGTTRLRRPRSMMINDYGPNIKTY